MGSEVVNKVTVTLIGKPGCHLCEVALEVIVKVITEIGDPSGVNFEELSLLDDPELMARYREQIPVVLLNGVVHDFLKMDPAGLQTAITGARSQ